MKPAQGKVDARENLSRRSSTMKAAFWAAPAESPGRSSFTAKAALPTTSYIVQHGNKLRGWEQTPGETVRCWGGYRQCIDSHPRRERKWMSLQGQSRKSGRAALSARLLFRRERHLRMHLSETRLRTSQPLQAQAFRMRLRFAKNQALDKVRVEEWGYLVGISSRLGP